MKESVLERRPQDGDSSPGSLDWLKREDHDVLEWQHAQAQDAIARLQQLGNREAAIAAFDSSIRQTRRFPPRRAGGLWFRQDYRGPEGRSVLIVGDAPDVSGRVIADARVANQAPRALDFYFPSRDGRHVAVGWSHGGSERSTIEIVETANGEVLPFTAPNARMGVVSWLGDGSGFYYDALSAAGQRRLFLYELGQAAAVEQVLNYRPGLIRARVAPDGSRVVCFSGYPNLVPVAWNDAGSRAAWRPLLAASDGSFSGDLVGDALITLTTEQARRGRIVSIPVATAEDRTTWRELVAESAVVIDTVSVVADRVVAGGLRAGAAGISVYDLDGNLTEDLALPPRSAISVRPIELSGVDPMFFAIGEDLFFLQHNATQSPAGYRYHVPTRSLVRVLEPGRIHDAITVRQGFATSSDGTSVPFEIVERANRSGPVPAMLHAYAGPYGLMPAYNWDLIEFVEAGGVVAIAHCRGGTEYGPDWVKPGRGPDGTLRQLEDLYAVAETVMNDGVAARGRLGFTGASAGAILAGIAFTQRPELFAAVCPQYALFDYAAIMPFLAPKGALDEAEHARQVAQVMSYSPYHGLTANGAYPATFIQMGQDDALTPLYSSRQITCRLREVHPSGDHLLRVYAEVGHVSAPTVRRLAEVAADWLIFCKGVLFRNDA